MQLLYCIVFPTRNVFQRPNAESKVFSVVVDVTKTFLSSKDAETYYGAGFLVKWARAKNCSYCISMGFQIRGTRQSIVRFMRLLQICLMFIQDCSWLNSMALRNAIKEFPLKQGKARC